MFFEKMLFGFVCVSALILFINRFVLGKRFDKKNPTLESWYVDYARSLFPVFLAVFIMRSFIFEPFRIPSSSMLPTLEIGDFLLVNKFSYGIRLPIIGTKVLSINDPERGDVLVFKYPKDPRQNYIKRVIGLPGDTIEYYNKRLFVNDNEVVTAADGSYEFVDASMSKHRTKKFIASLDNDQQHDFLVNPLRRSKVGRWIVPKGHYFAMGDNRDHSADSRSWGFVPDENIVGKAFFIWFHYDSVTDRGLNFSRIGNSIYQ